MQILNFGSCCIDHVYSVPHFVNPGETLSSAQYEIFPGGKGLNQSIALAMAGADVAHVGHVGEDGRFLKTLLDANNVDTSMLKVSDAPSGHAIIQVIPEGENAIVLFGGTNRAITEAFADEVISTTSAEYLLLQNEISAMDHIMKTAHDRGMKIILNAAPMTQDVAALPLSLLSLLIVNEIEGAALTGESDPDGIIEAHQTRYPDTRLLLTLGADGAVFADANDITRISAVSVDAIDTTGAGDTFTGYFVGEWIKGSSIETCLETATRAAAICVTRKGAASSIPRMEELA